MSLEKRLRFDISCDHCEVASTDRAYIPPGWAMVTSQRHRDDPPGERNEFHFCPGCWGVWVDIHTVMRGQYPDIVVWDTNGEPKAWSW